MSVFVKEGGMLLDMPESSGILLGPVKIEDDGTLRHPTSFSVLG
jgi:hypothetical protein